MSPGTCVVVRVFTSVYECLHEFTGVCGFVRCADCLNQDLLDFRWICGMVGVSRHGCGRMSVYERLREFA